MHDSFSEIIRLWPADDALAGEVGATKEQVKKWRLRDSVPSGWWQPLVDAARKRRFKSVTYQELARLAARESTPVQATGPKAA